MASSVNQAEQASVSSTDDTASLRLILLIIRRRWQLFVTTWFATVVGVAIFSLTMTKQYRPQASLEIRPETPLVAADTADPAMQASRNLWENYYRTQES